MRFPLFAFFLFLLSCSQPPKDQDAFDLMADSFQKNASSLRMASEEVIDLLEKQQRNVATAYRTRPWLLKANQVDSLTRLFVRYLHICNGSITGSMADSNEQVSPHKTSPDPWDETTQRVLIQKLNQYIDDVERLDASLNLMRQTKPLREQLNSVLDQALSSPGYANERTALLSKLIADVETVNFRILTLFKTSALPVVEHYYSLSVITNKNATSFKPGELLEVTTGLGKFYYEPTLQITIDGQLVPVDEIGVASWKTKVKDQPGSYVIPVRFEWSDQNGIRKSFEDQIRYHVLSNR